MEVLSSLLGESPAMVAVRDRAQRLLRVWSTTRRPPPVLIQGATGTGKGLLARLIHRASPRARTPFVDINCAAVPETLIEAELFGYERGAFTDARQAKPGLFQLAHQGTLFLDEVGLLTPAAQAKLLSALEEGAVRRLGSTRAEPIDVWVIAATNEDLKTALDERRFRQDLFHRLAVFTLELPPLRTRDADIVPLAEHFLDLACADYGLPVLELAPDARAALTSYAWPGNVRELANVIERAALLADAPVLTAAHLALPLAPRAADVAGGALAWPAPSVESARSEREELERVLHETGWNVSRTAAILGITRNTVRARMARWSLRRPGEDTPLIAEKRAPSVTPSPSAASAGAKAASWEPRRLTFLRVQVMGDRGAEVDSRLARQLDVAGDKLRGFGGRVEGLSPRAVLAVFGIDVLDEPTVLAGHGALVIRNAARKIRAEGGDLQVAIGLHAAEVLVREGDDVSILDADGSRQAWATLETVLQQAAPDSIIATAPTAGLLRRRFLLVPPAPATTSVVRVEGPWHAQVTARGSRGPFVGRGEELALLKSRLATAMQGHGQVADLVGEAGIGKSRLLVELVGSSPLDSVRCLEARCLPAEAQTPFYPMLQLARIACGIAEADPAAAIREKLSLAATEVGLDAHGVVSELLYLLGGRADPPEAPGPALTKRLYNALRQLFLTLATRLPLVIFVEDLHWIDPTSEACLATLIDFVASAPILVVSTYRSGYRAPWMARPEVLHLSLSPLRAEESLTVIRAVLRPGGSSAELEQSIQAKAEGNPLFLEELSLAVVERGDGTLPERLPATVEEAIASRLARFEPTQRRLLRAAAVIGREFSLRLLARVAEFGEGDLQAALRQFQLADFLFESGLGELGYTFRHALVQQAVYAGLSPAERRALHLRVLTAMEMLDPDRIADQVERLAHHAVLGDDRPRAVRYLLLAGQRAAARSALSEAIAHLHKGLELLEDLPRSPERDRQELSLRVAIGLAFRAIRGSAAPETEQAFARARELARRIGDHSQLGPVLVGEWASHLLNARYPAAQDLAEQLLALSEKDPDPLLGAVTHRALGMTALYRGTFSTVRQHLERGIALYRPDVHHARAVAEYGGDPHIGCLAYLGRALWCLGYPDQALARHREAVAEAETWGGALSRAIAFGMLTSVHHLRREVPEALAASERALAHATEWGITYWLAHSAVLKSWAETERSSGSAADARLREARRSLDQYRATGTSLGLTWLFILLAETYRASGRPREGLAALDDAGAHAAQSGERFHEAEIHRLRGELLLMEGGAAADAAACFGQALAVARQQHARAWELRAATSMARMLHEQRDDEAARALLGPVFGWFTEGFATADLQDARALLEAITPRA